MHNRSAKFHQIIGLAKKRDKASLWNLYTQSTTLNLKFSFHEKEGYDSPIRFLAKEGFVEEVELLGSLVSSIPIKPETEIIAGFAEAGEINKVNELLRANPSLKNYAIEGYAIAGNIKEIHNILEREDYIGSPPYNLPSFISYTIRGLAIGGHEDSIADFCKKYSSDDQIATIKSEAIEGFARVGNVLKANDFLNELKDTHHEQGALEQLAAGFAEGGFWSELNNHIQKYGLVNPFRVVNGIYKGRHVLTIEQLSKLLSCFNDPNEAKLFADELYLGVNKNCLPRDSKGNYDAVVNPATLLKSASSLNTWQSSLALRICLLQVVPFFREAGFPLEICLKITSYIGNISQNELSFFQQMTFKMTKKLFLAEMNALSQIAFFKETKASCHEGLTKYTEMITERNMFSRFLSGHFSLFKENYPQGMAKKHLRRMDALDEPVLVTKSNFHS